MSEKLGRVIDHVATLTTSDITWGTPIQTSTPPFVSTYVTYESDDPWRRHLTFYHVHIPIEGVVRTLRLTHPARAHAIQYIEIGDDGLPRPFELDDGMFFSGSVLSTL